MNMATWHVYECSHVISLWTWSCDMFMDMVMWHVYECSLVICLLTWSCDMSMVILLVCGPGHLVCLWIKSCDMLINVIMWHVYECRHVMCSWTVMWYVYELGHVICLWTWSCDVVVNLVMRHVYECSHVIGLWTWSRVNEHRMCLIFLSLFDINEHKHRFLIISDILFVAFYWLPHENIMYRHWVCILCPYKSGWSCLCWCLMRASVYFWALLDVRDFMQSLCVVASGVMSLYWGIMCHNFLCIWVNQRFMCIHCLEIYIKHKISVAGYVV